MIALRVLIASTRPGRLGLPVSEWAIERATAHGAFDVQVLDLAEVALPFLDEPNHPRLRQYTKPHTKRWSATIQAAEAFVFVVPEYNYGMNAPLKNAIDYLHSEWHYKPVGFVSYGGISAGTRGVQMAKQVVTSLKMFPLFEAVQIPFVRQFMGEDGAFHPNEELETGMVAMLAELEKLALALRPLQAD
jgi:NAD(P)H-dependent FMN reductase